MQHFDNVVASRLAYPLNSGFWKVNNRCFFKKVECLRYASQINDYNVRYQFFDEVFMTLDWTKDTTRTLDQIYADRAKQIRDKYNYVMLLFSGGADSRNVLDTFLENNLRIDEIVCYYPLKVIDKQLPEFDPTDKGPTQLIHEWHMACKPVLKELEKSHPNIKITILDYTEDSLEIIESGNAHLLDMSGLHISPVLGGHLAVAKLMKERSEKYGTVGCATGGDKPVILYNKLTDAVGYAFGDFSNILCKTNVDGFVPSMEPFYHSPDMPDLPVAQIRALGKAVIPLINDGKCELKTTPFKDVFRVPEHTDFVKQVLYKNYNPTVWQADKTTTLFNFAGNAWFETELTSKRVKDFYQGQLLEWYHGVKNDLLEIVNGEVVKLKPYRSRIYWTK